MTLSQLDVSFRDYWRTEIPEKSRNSLSCIRLLSAVPLAHISDSWFVVFSHTPVCSESTVWITRLPTLREKTFSVYFAGVGSEECLSAGLSAIFHTVFYQPNLLAMNEYHTLGKPSRIFTAAHLFECARDSASADRCAPSFFRAVSPFQAHTMKMWMAAIFPQLWDCVCNIWGLRIL